MQTIAKLLEMLFSSLGLVQGEFIDATPFRHVNARWAMQQLMEAGYGTEEYMIDGTTGVMMERPWFIGSCFYQTLKHMVLDKITMRQRGQRAVLTRQPLDGRANQGGQRMGGMEVDALLAHGAAFCLDDRSRIASDAHTALVCTHCGHVGDSKEETLRDLSAAAVSTARAEPCRLCGAHDSMVSLPTTYCYSRLLLPELATCGVKVVHKFSTGGDRDESACLGADCSGDHGGDACAAQRRASKPSPHDMAATVDTDDDGEGNHSDDDEHDAEDGEDDSDLGDDNGEHDAEDGGDDDDEHGEDEERGDEHAFKRKAVHMAVERPYAEARRRVHGAGDARAAAAAAEAGLASSLADMILEP